MADWSRLPKDLLELIAKHLDTCVDIVHFRSVCCSWRSSVPPGSRHLFVRCSLPILGDDPRNRPDGYCYLEKIPVFLFRFLQSSHDQTLAAADCRLVAIIERTYGKMELWSPFRGSPILSGSRIWLNTLNCQFLPLGHEYVVWYPRLRNSSEGENLMFSPGKAAFLQAKNEDGDFAVLAKLHVRNLAMFRTTDMRWTVLENTPERYLDIFCFKGKFYVIDYSGRIVVIAPSLDVSFLPDTGARASDKKLVQSGDELLLVEIFSPKACLDDGPPHRLTWCRVFKLDEEAREWIRVRDLGDRVLFINLHWRFCCSANELPLGLKGNIIIFRIWEAYARTALVFSLADGSIRSIDHIRRYSQLFCPNLESAISNGLVTRQNALASFCEL